MTTATQAGREALIEMIMALYGRLQPNPVAYRRHLNALDYQELETLHRELTEGK